MKKDASKRILDDSYQDFVAVLLFVLMMMIDRGQTQGLV